jgi:hypothetical protein
VVEPQLGARKSTQSGSQGFCVCNLKGQCHEIFDFGFFSRISFSQLQIATGVVDTSGKITTRINNTSETGGKIFQPVSLIPVVYLDLRISPRIFKKIQNGPNGIFWGWGKTDSLEKPGAKIS